jgi:hypothetical protein
LKLCPGLLQAIDSNIAARIDADDLGDESIC